MKIAIIADIHANASALSVVLAAARNACVDALFVAGDLIGYYFEPAQVLSLLREWKNRIYIVRGNHEDLLLAAMHSAEILNDVSQRYGPGIRIALEQLTCSELSWIQNLPHPLEFKIRDRSIILCHGSPYDIGQYIYPDSSFESIFDTLTCLPDILVMGHTHYPMIRLERQCLLINPGSVGQPRNREPGAHWALLDTLTMAVEHRIESYDNCSLVNKCMELAPGFPYLCSVLGRS